MKATKLLIAIVFVQFSLTAVFSQTSTNTDGGVVTRPDYMKSADVGRARQDAQVKKVIEQSRVVVGPRGKVISAEERKAAELEKTEALEEINKLLSPPHEYEAKYAEFLKTKKTGLARMFPDRSCDKGKVVSVAELERCSGTAPIWGAGSIYSFRLNKLPSNLSLGHIHNFIRISDIHFVDGKFEVGTKTIQDIIADIGEVELSDVTLRSDSVKFLKSFEPETSARKIALQREELEKGVNESGFFYSTSAPVKLDRTYILRSISYSLTGYKFFWYTDVITAFKVVGQESDGSVVLLWKELKESWSPTLRK